MQIHTNGYMTFGTSSTTDSSTGSGSSGESVPVFAESSGLLGSKGQPTTLFSTSVPILGVFISDVDTTGTGNISYRLALRALHVNSFWGKLYTQLINRR